MEREIANRVEDRGMVYEQRWILCGKANCSRCNASAVDQGHPLGHGPYWYMMPVVKGKKCRLYVGSKLDTRKLRNDDGTVNWAGVYQRRRARAQARGEGVR